MLYDEDAWKRISRLAQDSAGEGELTAVRVDLARIQIVLANSGAYAREAYNAQIALERLQQDFEALEEENQRLDTLLTEREVT